MIIETEFGELPHWEIHEEGFWELAKKASDIYMAKLSSEANDQQATTEPPWEWRENRSPRQRQILINGKEISMPSEQEKKLCTDPMLQFFTYLHLPEHLRKVSRPFCELAFDIVATLPRNPERTVALRKLLEAKDCAVRASLYEEA